MKIKTKCAGKTIVAGSTLMIMVQLQPAEGHGVHHLYLTEADAEGYKLGAEYTVTVEATKAA